MNLCGLQFTSDAIDRVHRMIEQPTASRRSLARGLCQCMDWKSASGRLKKTACRDCSDVKSQGTGRNVSIGRLYSLNSCLVPLRITNSEHKPPVQHSLILDIHSSCWLWLYPGETSVILGIPLLCSYRLSKIRIRHKKN